MIHRLAQFLLNNSKKLESNYLDGKTSLIYFIFKYGKCYQNEHYNLFAFEHFEQVLAEEFFST